jgi:hypothetical protein
MDKWKFTVKELLSLQQEAPDTQTTCEAYVEWVLLNGYKISKTK